MQVVTKEATVDIRARIGIRVKELRDARKLSQDSLAYSINMSRSYLAEVETGKRNVSIQNIVRITEGLDVSVKEFFDSDLFA